MKYHNYNDNELIYISRTDEETLEFIYEKYKNAILKIIKKYKFNNPNINLDINDIYQEGLITLNNAIKTYDLDSDIKFSTYLHKCINNKMISIIRNHETKKEQLYNNALEIDYNQINNYEIKEYILTDIEYNEFEELFINNLKGLERKIVKYKIYGFKNEEIKKILNIDNKQINNATLRIRNKLKS